MRDLSKLLAVVLLSASLSAQDKGASSAAPTQWTADAHNISAGCPVRFGAAVSSRATAWTATDRPRDPSAILLQLSFKATGSTKISRASVRVHGWVSERRFVPVGAPPQEDRTQLFQLTDTGEGSGLVNRSVRVNRMLVRWAEITELSYADGSVWRASRESYCRATPSLFHLIEADAQ